MGRVFLAERGGQRFALKLIHPHMRSGLAVHARFEREAEIGKRVVHENVVRTYDAGSAAGREFLVMDYVDGQTLAELVAELQRVPEQLVRGIARAVAAGLGAIHAAGAVHRDVKPSNVLITGDHEVKVMDLGLAYLAGEAGKLSRTGAFLGSVAYASPEQFRGKDAALDGRSDLFSLGVVLYELLTGEHPFVADDMAGTIQAVLTATPRRLGRLNPQVSPFLEEVVHVLLAKERDDRFASAEAFLRVLDQGESGAWWKDRAAALRRSSGRALRRIRVPRDTDVYGRDDELATLRALFDQADGGDGQVVVLEGEAGIGKTRLVDELVARLGDDGRDFHFLHGSYPPGAVGVAAGAFAQAYRELLGEEDLEEALLRHLPDTPSLVPSFAAMMRGVAARDGAAALGSEALRTLSVLLTRAFAAERTTVLLIDDLHFAGEAARGLFAALALAAPRHRLLLVGTTRPMPSSRWTKDLEQLPHAAALRLTRLGPNDLAKLLVDAFRSERLASDLSMKIAQKSDGNPFFALEIIRGLKEGQFLTRRPDGSWVSTQLIEEITIPESVTDLVRARISDLSEEDQELLEVAACCGFEFRADWVAETLGLARIPFLRRLGKIERTHRVVRAVGPRFVFDHHQIQEALYAGLSEPLREEYHAELAAALERLSGGARDGAVDAQICHHYLRGKQGDAALPYLRSALDHLAARARHHDVVAIATAALEAPGLLTGDDRCELLLRQAARLGSLGRRDAESAACEEALALAGTPALRSRALVMRSRNRLLTSAFEGAQADGEEALALAREAGDRLREFHAQTAVASVISRVGHYRESVDLHTQCADLAREIENEEAVAIALGNCASGLSLLGEHEQAFELHEQVVAHHERGDDRDALAGALVNIAQVAQRLNRFGDSLALAERGLDLAQQVGNRMWAGNACMALGNTSQNLGRYEDARDWQERGLAIMVELGNREGEAGTLINMGTISAFLGEKQRARDLLTRGRELARAVGQRQYETVALSGLAGIADKEEEALAIRLEALALNREMSLLPAVAGSLLSIGQLEVRLARGDSAAARFDEALALGRRMNDGMLILGAAALRTQLPGADVDAALEALVKYRNATRRPALVQSLHCLWRATADTELLEESHTLLRELQAALPEEKRERFVTADSLHRAIVADWTRVHAQD